MSPKDVLRTSIKGSDRIITSYLSDLSDADLLVRAVPGMNHIAWQMGHLIVSGNRMMNMIEEGSAPALPEGFAAAHNKEAAASDDPSQFTSRATYVELWEAGQKAALALLERTPEARLDEADPKFPAFAPTVGALFGALSYHPMMHAGQFVAVRRKEGKPVLM
ncbi:DinB family protein [Aquisphaera insulae]|uniref:DinB family protein n=1 Tax=Aquisphaera insulae TaxID=2712864 RepID=UPI0013EC4EB6|nr:DinB family protein [Aquisphaera insulae]